MCGPTTCRANARLLVPHGVADRWDPRDVTLASPVTSPSSARLFPFRWCRRAKAPGSPPWRRRGVPPRAAAASRPTTCPSAPAAISSCATAPRVLPTLAASGENPPLSTPPPEKEKRGRRSRRPSVGTPFAAKTRASRGRSQTRRRRARLLALLPHHHAVVFILLADEPHRPSSPTPTLRPVATEVRTSFPCPLWTPRPSSRGERDAPTAPPRRHHW
jgi:hypothetical protein